MGEPISANEPVVNGPIKNGPIKHAPMGDAPVLAVDVKHRLGSLNLHAAFTLGQPWTVLFGPSGAGKSSLLRIIAGLVRPDSGEVRLGAKTLVDSSADIFVPPGRRSVGFLTQEPALLPHLDVRRNVGFGLHGVAVREREARIDAVLRLLHADALARRMPATLSGGERQRVALARTLAPEPRLLLLDEPFAALDAQLRSAILEDVAEWLRIRGTPVLYVSHDLAEALQTGSEVIALRDGKTIAQGPAAVVLAEERRELLRSLGARD